MSSEIFQLANLGVLQASGLDRKTFLQGQLSCNVDRADATQAIYGGYCNAAGRLIASFWLLQMTDCYYLLLPRETIPHTLAELQRYAIFSKITLSDESASMTCLMSAQQDALTDSFGLAGVADTYITFTTHTNHYPDGNMPWHIRIIKAGIPLIYPETQRQFLPHRVNMHLLGGLDFEKGCYLGQEIIARLHYRGQIKHHMYRLQLASDKLPSPGNTVSNTDGKKLGEVVDAVQTQTDTIEALIILPMNAVACTELVIDKVTTSITQLPLPYAIT